MALASPATSACGPSERDLTDLVEEEDQAATLRARAVVCEALRLLDGVDADASSAIQACIDETPSGGILALPAGRYTLADRVTVSRNITLTTEQRTRRRAPCALEGASGCAELVADAHFLHVGGFFDLAADGASIVNLVFDGNREARMGSAAAEYCAGGANGYGYNIRVMCSHCSVKNSISKNALCGTALEVSGRGTNVTISGNIIANNGVHNRSGLWADGVTLHDYSDTRITRNTIVNSTDIDLILGGCVQCTVKNNRITHDRSSTGSFAALMIQRWPNGTSGNYTGSKFSSNVIDCGPNKACGFGILIGSNPWYAARIQGGEVYNNVIRNPQQGLAIQDASDVAVYRNRVSGRDTATRVTCHVNTPKTTSDYSMSADALNIDHHGENALMYSPIDWAGCIPNWAL
ncbi:MAG: hypothetical protein H6729_10850 [Deltaproteobacteria bacterium]|nr:hypothetical protein [Deltaproteobacteria bacterium]